MLRPDASAPVVVKTSLPFTGNLLCQGEKRKHHHHGTPPFSVCRPTPTSQSKKRYGVYHFLGNQENRVYTIGPERRVYTIEASDPEKEEKEGFHSGGVYFFLPLRWSKTRVLKTDTLRVETRVLKTLACRNGFWTSFKQW